LRSLNPAVTEREIVESEPVWQEIRDKLTVLALTRWRELYDVKQSLKNPSGKITAREYELWHPVFCVLKWVGGDELLSKIIPWAEAKAEEKQNIELNDSRDLILLRALVNNVDRDGEYSASEIKEWVKKEFAGEEEQKWLRAEWVGRALRRLGFLDSRKLSKAGGRHYYFIRYQFLQGLAHRAGLLLPEEIKQSLNMGTSYTKIPVFEERAEQKNGNIRGKNIDAHSQNTGFSVQLVQTPPTHIPLRAEKPGEEEKEPRIKVEYSHPCEYCGKPGGVVRLRHGMIYYVHDECLKDWEVKLNGKKEAGC